MIYADMTMDLANSWWMYLLGAVVCVFVLASSIIFIVRAIRDAKKISMDKKVIKKTIINSILFSLLPSISILFGVVALSAVIGIPLPWIRLSVIGALHYEGAAIDAAYDGITMFEMTTNQYATISVVMTLGILTGPLFCLFGFKAYDKKVISKLKTDNNAEVTGEKKKTFGPILFNAAFIAMICSFLAEDFAKLKYVGSESALNSWTPAVVIAVSFGVMAICDLISKKCKAKWIDDFSIGLAMIAGMVVASLIG